MVRWRCSLILALLLLLPARIGGNSDDDDEEESNDDENNDNEPDDDDERDEGSMDKTDTDPRRRVVHGMMPTPKNLPVTRTTTKRPLECYVCAYKIQSPLKSCLDPIKHRVHTMTCHSMDDRCFTTVTTKNGARSGLQGLVRGCRSGCVASLDTTCCELNRCNNQAFAMPIISTRSLSTNKTTKSIPTTVLFFVTILLVLQTVVKVAFV